MGTEKNLQEALRWLKTAEDDLDAAQMLSRNGMFPHACFHSQQAGEKALKAVWFHADADPWGHSIRRLIEELERVDLKVYDRMKGLMRAGTILDRFYIPTRYPNGLPELTPKEAYLAEDAELCVQLAGEILDGVRSLVTPGAG